MNGKNEDNITNTENHVLVNYSIKDNKTNLSIIKNKKDGNDNNSQFQIEVHNSNSNDYKHKFYLARLKHGLIISFLALVPLQSLILCSISYSFEIVSIIETTIHQHLNNISIF